MGGCISSKIMARSISLHEEQKQALRVSANGIPLLEDLIISASSGDQYLALIRTANTVVSNKLDSKNVRSSNTPSTLTIEPAASSETNDESEISEGLIEQEEGKQVERENKDGRSKSWHWFSEQIENSSEAKDNLSSKGDIGSRSFHTVEEFDDMVNKLGLSNPPKIQQNNEECEVSSSIKDFHYPCSHSQCPLEEGSEMVTPSLDSQISSSGTKIEEVGQIQRTSYSSSIEKGNKKKAIAKRIGSLRIQSSLECASLREWLPLARGIYSPGSYVTPKFGSYSQADGRNGNESGEDPILSPELLSAFEECMREFEVEEESILKQIMEGVEDESGGGLQPQEQDVKHILADEFS